VELGVQARQHQRDRPRARRIAELALEPRQIAPAEAVQRRDDTRLMEIAQGDLPVRSGGWSAGQTVS
jgi:hypothetical protein